ncbi:Vesicle-mediated ER to Golgi transport protein [Paramarasmius palmivorus]|uniref:Vesicle-mediated ER to Golgi transport protein n=1 Tax=Paramarasmius palmivorus TaxID=297713 RepID=A0AAW0DK45_9AGAR
MEFLSQTYVALRGPTGAPQTAADTVGKLSDRLSPATLLADRRAAVLALKGLARDHKQDVGERALPGLLQVLYNDAEVDSDIGKAVLETLSILCDVEDGTGKELGLRYTDAVLESEQALHALLGLLADNSFYTQAIAVLQALISQSPDIQKVLAFEGAFEKLFNIISQEGGVDGGAVAQEALACIDGFLRLNSSNQSYFRETGLPASLCSLLLFPPNLQIQEPTPQEFALQFWDDQKLANASAIVGIIGLLVGSKAQGTQDQPVFVRLFVEMALASNAPTALKTKALTSLPSNLNFPLAEFILTPYMPVPETNGEEWDRLEAATALDALVELALHGEYNGLDSGKRAIAGLELRVAAVNVFENFVRKEEMKQGIIQTMLPPGGSPPNFRRQHRLIQSLIITPTFTLDPALVTSTQFASLVLSHLLRGSPRAKSLARSIKPNPVSTSSGGGAFFVPADAASQPPAAPEPPVEDDDEPPQTLIQILTENLSLAFLARARADNSDREAREWDRTDCGLYVFTFTMAVGRAGHTIYPILNRLGVDTLIGRMSRLRDDDRFKAVSPELTVLPFQTSSHPQSGMRPEDREGEVWFDWTFVDFWKSNYYTVQRGLSTEPDQLASSSAGQTAELTMLVASLREVIRTQAQEIESLQAQLKQQQKPAVDTEQINALKNEVTSLTTKLKASEEKQKETEREHEDLLVLVDELSNKRSRDKVTMRTAGLDVSEDEEEEEEEEEEE